MWRCVCPLIFLDQSPLTSAINFFFLLYPELPFLDNRFGIDPNPGQVLQRPSIYRMGGNKLLAHLDVHAASLWKAE